MRKSKQTKFLLVIGLLVLIVVSVSLFVLSSKPLYAKRCPDGWKEVCCGSWCKPYGDYCIGTGTFCCCK